MLNVIMQIVNVIVLNAIVLMVILMNGIMLRFIMLNNECHFAEYCHAVSLC
jgi:hypothetical protein